MATSATGGFLTPTSQEVPYDDQLLDLLQPAIVGIGGYPDPSLVRPRWQTPDVPNLPEYGTDWAAFGIPRFKSDAFNYEAHVDSGAGYSLVESTEEFDLLVSCYGPNAQRLCSRLRDGFKVEQNRAYLHQYQIDLLVIGEPVTVPALLQAVWVKRVDLTLTMRRYISRSYGVLTVLDAELGIDNEQYITPIVLQAP